MTASFVPRARDNGHGAKTYGNPIGVECEACKRRALVPLDRLGQGMQW
jgi:hypothetical protein